MCYARNQKIAWLLSVTMLLTLMTSCAKPTIGSHAPSADLPEPHHLFWVQFSEQARSGQWPFVIEFVRQAIQKSISHLLKSPALFGRAGIVPLHGRSWAGE